MENITELNPEQMEEVSGGRNEGGYAKKPDSKKGCIIYQVQSRDTLTKIASRYNTTVSAIMRVNSELVDKNFIVTGCYIYVPAK